MNVISIEKLEVSYNEGIVILNITTDTGTPLEQHWEIDPAFNTEQVQALVNVFSVVEDDFDVVLDAMDAIGNQISGIRLYESLETVGAEGFLDGIKTKIANLFKKAEKFGKFNVKEAGSLYKAIEANLDKTLKNEKWLEDNYSANGTIEINLEYIGTAKDVQPDNWIDKLIENSKVERKYYGNLKDEIVSTANKVESLAEDAVEDKPENLSKHLAKLKEVKAINDIAKGDKPFVYPKAKLEVNCPSPEYLTKLGELYLDIVKHELDEDDVWEAYIAPEHVLLPLQGNEYDEDDVEEYYLNFSRIVNMEDAVEAIESPFGYFVYDLIQQIMKKGKH